MFAGVCGVDVAHGGVGGDVEHAHEVDWVGGCAGFVEDAVASELGVVDAEGFEYLP